MQRWRRVDAAAARFMELAHWTHWISCWAKTHERAGNREGRTRCYDLKHSALERLAQAPHVRISWVPSFQQLDIGRRGRLEGKIALPELCERHEQECIESGCFEREEYIASHWSLLRSCEVCGPRLIEHETKAGLYHLDLIANRPELMKGVELPDVDFDFHVPHRVGSRFLPEPDALPSARHRALNSDFQFGRALSRAESRSFPESVVAGKLLAILNRRGDTDATTTPPTHNEGRLRLRGLT